MLLRVFFALVAIVAVALPTGEAAAVLCIEVPGEPMPCCEQGLADCGSQGMLGDCCVVVPGESGPPAVAAWTALDAASVLRGQLAAQPSSALPEPVFELGTSAQLRPASARVPDHARPFFSRTTALRI
jgi:hypothetical protein